MSLLRGDKRGYFGWILLVAQPTVDATSSLPVKPGDTSLTGEDRFKWVVLSTVGPKNLGGGLVVVGIQTWGNDPQQYGPHWDGFAKAYGARLGTGDTINWWKRAWARFGAKIRPIFVRRVNPSRAEWDTFSRWPLWLATVRANFAQPTHGLSLSRVA